MATTSGEWLLRILGFVGGFAALPLLAIGACHVWDPCENDVLTEVPAPSGERKVVVFDRGCGATTGNTVQISILDWDDAAPTGGGNVFIADFDHGKAPRSGLSVRWLSEDRLEVTLDRRLRVFHQSLEEDGIDIQYLDAAPSPEMGL